MCIRDRSGTVNFAVRVNDPLPSGVDDVTNVVSVTDDGANGPDSDPTNNSDVDDTPISAAPDLHVIKDDGQTTVGPNATLIYTLSYGNDGSQDAANVVLTESLPPGTTFDAANSSAGWSETSPGVWELSLGTVVAGTGGTRSFAVVVDDPLAAGISQLVNSVTIADDGTNGPDENPNDNSDTDTDTVNATPDLYIEKDDGNTTTTAGASVIYTINYGNDGDQSATGVVITEDVPVGATFDFSNSTNGWVESPVGSGTYQFNVGALDAGDTGTVAFAVFVDDPLAAGLDQLVNNTSIADDGANGQDPDPTDNADNDVDTINAVPNLVITKTDGGITSTPGGTIVYTLTYSNDGDQDATGVVITESVPANTSFNSAASDTGWTENPAGSGTYEFNVGNLPVGTVGTVTFAVTVDSIVPSGVSQIDNATVIADDGANGAETNLADNVDCLLYTSPSPRDATLSRMPSSA